MSKTNALAFLQPAMTKKYLSQNFETFFIVIDIAGMQ
jgi:hypothetical protein